MSKKNLRWYLIVFHALGPMIAIGAAAMIFLLIFSLFFSGDLGIRIRLLALWYFGVFLMAGLVLSVVVVWKARNLD
jgi:hypothetical protein